MTETYVDIWVYRAKIASIFLAVASGLGLGIGSYTFVYARGFSYMTDSPEACANCHIMQGHFDAWIKSSHHAVAVCNDCHTPHSFFGKYWVKALNGFHHSLAFTTGNFPDTIMIKPKNRAVTENTCRSCHADMVERIDAFGHGPQALDCIRCHNSVGHLR